MTVGLNLARYSNQLTKPLWGTIAVAIADLGIDTTSPTGRSARVIYSVSGENWAFEQGSIPEWQPNTQFTAAVWVKQESMPDADIWMVLADASGNGVLQNFNPTTWATSTTPAGSTPVWSSQNGGVIALADSWYMIWVTGTTPATANSTLSVGMGGAPDPIGSSFQCGGFVLYQGTDTTFVATTTAPLGSQFLPTFPPLWHRTQTTYPENSVVVKFGNGYSFSSPPRGPPQRTFSLECDALRFFFTADGTIDTTSFPNFNAGSLDAFYQTVQLYQTFNYPHPLYGNLLCRFAKPLVIPMSEEGGFAVIKKVQMELIEVPT